MSRRLPISRRSSRLLPSDLPKWLADTGDDPWEWGVNDCGIWVANWILARRGIDVAEPWRGRYRSARECHEIVRNAGGYINLVRERMRACGLPEVTAARTGDVGLVRFHEARPTAYVGSMMGIWDGSGWVVKMDRGLASGDYHYHLIWEI